MKQIHSFTIFRNVALSYSELLMIIKSRDFYVLGHISNIFASLWAKTVMNWKRFWLETVGYRSVNLFTTVLNSTTNKNVIFLKLTFEVATHVNSTDLLYFHMHLVIWDSELQTLDVHVPPQGCLKPTAHFVTKLAEQPSPIIGQMLNPGFGSHWLPVCKNELQ